MSKLSKKRLLTFPRLLIILLTVFSVVFLLQPKPTRQAKAAESGLWSTGYYVGWEQDRMPPDQIDYGAVTHVAHFSMWPRPDGSIDLKFLTPQYAREAVAAAHRAGRKIILVFGCEGAGSDFARAASQANRSKFIANMINQVTTYGYDGLDIDWEDNINRADYIALIRELRTELEKIDPNLLLTAAVNMYRATPEIMANVDDELDQINIMSYWEPPRDASMTTQVQAYLAAGIPASKIGGGIGLGDDGGIDTTPEKVRAKCEYAKNHGLGGVMMWKLDDAYRAGSGFDQRMEVIKEYIRTLNPTLTGCPRKTEGDGNCDGSIGGIDYSLWLNSQCRRSATQSCARTVADFNGDGNTDDDDYTIWFTYRGT